MGLLDRIKQGAAKRKADKAKKNAKWENPTQPAAKPAAKRNGSGPDKKGNDSYKPSTTKKPATKREPQKVISLEKKKPQKLQTAELKDSKLKPRTNTEPKKKPLSLYQKDLLAQKNKTGKYAVKKPGPDYSKPQPKTPAKGPTDSRTPDQIAKGNKRAITNRHNKSKAKTGETYTYTDSKGKKQTVTK